MEIQGLINSKWHELTAAWGNLNFSFSVSPESTNLRTYEPPNLQTSKPTNPQLHNSTGTTPDHGTDSTE